MRYFLLLFLFSTLAAAEKKGIYLCARLSPQAKEWNCTISKLLEKDYTVFLPQDIDLSTISHAEIDHIAYQKCLEGMKKSDLLLLLPHYGRDCAWEVGWFCGQGKAAIAYAEEEGEWIKDGMVKGGLSLLITNNPTLFEKLKQDPAFANKVVLISSREQLPKVIP